MEWSVVAHSGHITFFALVHINSVPCSFRSVCLEFRVFESVWSSAERERDIPETSVYLHSFLCVNLDLPVFNHAILICGVLEA